MSIINCYTDASYSNHKNISVVAYKIDNLDIQTIIYNNVKNTQAEILGIEYCIQYCLDNINMTDIDMINIFTDCQNAWKQDFNKLCPNIKINLIKIKGHQKMDKMTNDDLIFKQVDKMARKTLRNL